MKKLLSPKLSNWFSSIDHLAKSNDKICKPNALKISNIVNEFKTDSSILPSINNIFLDLIYCHHNQDDKGCLETIQSICNYIAKLFTYSDRKIGLIAIEIMPSFLFAYLCICFSTINDPSVPKRQRSRRRSSTISPFNDSKKSSQCQFLKPFSILDILECCLLTMYNHELENDVIFRSSDHEFRFPYLIDASIYSNAIFNLQNSGIESLSRESHSQSSTSLIPNSAPIGIPIYPSYNSLDVNKSTENGSCTDLGSNSVREYSLVVNGENRSKIITYFLDIYMENISDLSQTSLISMMKLITQFHPERQQILIPPRPGRKASNLKLSRFPELGKEVYLEMISIAYYSLFNGVVNRALEAINAIEARVNLEFCYEVIMVVNAIKNSLENSLSSLRDHSPLGLNLDEKEHIVTSLLSFSDIGMQCGNDWFNTSQGVQDREDSSNNELDNSTQVTSPCKPKLRSIITNASFRTMKLPDDIPIIEANGFQNNLNINSPSGTNLKNSSSKLASIKSSKTPRFKFDFRSTEKFEGIKECVIQEQCATSTSTNHSMFFAKSRKSNDDDLNGKNSKNEDQKKLLDY